MEITGNFSKRLFKTVGILFSVSLAVFLLMATPALAAEESYVSGENITVHLLLDVNDDVPAQVQVMVYNPENRLVTNSTHDINLKAGENEIDLTVPFQTDTEGLHYLRYDIFARLNGKYTLIVSSTQYFDGEFNDPPSIELLAPEEGGDYPSGVPIQFSANVTDPESQEVTVTWTSDLSGLIGTGTSFSKSLDAGLHRITITAEDKLGKSRTLSFSIALVQSSVTIEIAPGQTLTIPLALIDTTAPKPSIKLPENLSLVVQASEVPAPASGTVGPTIDFTSNVSSFGSPVKITLGYNASQVSETSKLKLAWYDKGSGKWIIVENSTVDTVAHTVSGYVSHFTPFAPVIETAGDEGSTKKGGSGGTSSIIIRLKETFNTSENSENSGTEEKEILPVDSEETEEKPEEENTRKSEEKTSWIPGFGVGLTACLISAAYLGLRRKE